MNRSDLVAEVARRAGMPRFQAASAVATLTDVVRDALARGEKVSLSGFGAFEVRNRAARKGRNVVTGQAICIPAGKALVFRPSRHLKGLVKNSART